MYIYIYIYIYIHINLSPSPKFCRQVVLSFPVFSVMQQFASEINTNSLID